MYTFRYIRFIVSFRQNYWKRRAVNWRSWFAAQIGPDVWYYSFRITGCFLMHLVKYVQTWNAELEGIYDLIETCACRWFQTVFIFSCCFCRWSTVTMLLLEWLETSNYCMVCAHVCHLSKLLIVYLAATHHIWKAELLTTPQSTNHQYVAHMVSSLWGSDCGNLQRALSGANLNYVASLFAYYQICLQILQSFGRVLSYSGKLEIRILSKEANHKSLSSGSNARQTSGGNLLPTWMHRYHRTTAILWRQDLLTVADVSHNAHNATPRWLHSDGWQFSKHLHLLNNYTSHVFFRHFVLNVRIEWSHLAILTTWVNSCKSRCSI